MVKLLALSDLHVEFVPSKPNDAVAAAADVEAEAVDIGRVGSRGGNLWDFEPFGHEQKAKAMREASHCMNDFARIKVKKRQEKRSVLGRLTSGLTE